jgi:competence protein ComGC
LERFFVFYKVKSLDTQKGLSPLFIEMMIVLMIISVLLIITIPNVTKHNGNINKKGCDAYLKMVQAQVQSYEMEYEKLPTMQELIDLKYIKTGKSPCGTIEELTILETGEVIKTDSVTPS